MYLVRHRRTMTSELVRLREAAGFPILAKFPNAGNKTLGRKLHKDHPDLWLDAEKARTWVRTKRGAFGKKKREQSKAKEYQRPIREPGNPFGKLPESLAELEDTSAYNLDCNRCLVLADVHLPFHDEEATRVALEYGKRSEVDSIVLLGDLMDCYSISRWVTDPRMRNLAKELDAAKQFLGMLREAWPDAKIVYKAGNHEERWESYLYCRAPDLVGVADFEIDKVLKLGDLGITWLDRMRHIKIGRLNLVHGHEFGMSAYSPVNAARGLFLRSKAITMCGHFHQTSQHSETTMEDQNIPCWSVGMLGDLRPRYRRYNTRWNNGFAMVDMDDGFRVHNRRIVKGEVY